ncbi:MAG: bifunctional aspartate kinase/homoserine dehydrogenase I [Calditrichaeota bacterium]|nr:bifunctional aspartate kinase/homoserine dehydrogenase I [Calditrichota bacterium]
MVKVLKIGGSSLGSKRRVRNVADIIVHSWSEGSILAVVVSAIGGITDQLLDCAHTAEINGELAKKKIEKIRHKHFDVYSEELKDKVTLDRVNTLLDELKDLLKGVSLVRECSPRTLDLVLSFGERLSAFLMTALLRHKGLNAEYVDARDLVITNNNHGNARVLKDETYNWIQYKINKPKIYVITGFIGSNKDGITTTIGRGGSDYTAALFAAALDSESIEIWTDVDGFMSADPRMVKEAFVLPQVSYEEAMEMSFFGAKVIHPQTLVPAIAKNIPVYIKNSFSAKMPGTLISPEKGDFEHPVKGIASFEGISLINVQGTGMVGVPGIAGRLFGALARKNINIVMITQASSEHSISFVVQSREAPAAKNVLEIEFENEIAAGKIDKIESSDNLSIIAAVGDNMAGTPGISGKLFGALGRNSINVIAIAQGSSERNVSLVVEKEDTIKAVNVIHSAFYLSHRVSNLFVVGTGSVGSQLLEQIRDRQKELAEKSGLVINICGLANSKTMVIDENGIDLNSWRKRLSSSKTPLALDKLLNTILKLRLINSVLVDVTASEQVAARYNDFLSAGIHIVTPNKKANTMSQSYYNKLKQLSAGRRLHYYYEATVGAGLPIINTIQNLKNSGDEVIKIQGILSGTISYLFNNLTAERKFSQVVKEAYDKGYTEPDPRDDLSGMDVARKLLILSREIGLNMELPEVEVESLLPPGLEDEDLDVFWQRLPEFDETIEKRRAKAEAAGMALRYLGSLENNKCKVSIKEIPATHAIAQSGATDNIIQITTKRYYDSPLTIQGPGAGLEVTAGGVFADIISLGFHLS